MSLRFGCPYLQWKKLYLEIMEELLINLYPDNSNTL